MLAGRVLLFKMASVGVVLQPKIMSIGTQYTLISIYHNVWNSYSADVSI